MKKIVALLAAMAVLALAASCGGGAAPAATPAPVAATPVPAADPEAASNEVLFEDFSMKPFWFAVANSWGDGDKSTEAVWDKAAGALECKFAFAEGKPATYQIEEPELNDWSGVTALKIDVTNKTGVTLKALVAVCTEPTGYGRKPPTSLWPRRDQTTKFAPLGHAEGDGWATAWRELRAPPRGALLG